MPNAAIYVRLSRYRAGETDVAPETQRRACQAYCEARGWTVTSVYEDLDISGGSLDRPELDRLRKEWQRYDHVVFHKLDRLSRSLSDFLTLNTEAEASGVALASVSDNLDMSTPIGRFVAQILAAFAEMERATIIARTRAGKQTARELGLWSGGRVQFGFRVVDNRLLPDERETALIREALSRRAEGQSWSKIALWLQAERDNRKWDARTLRRALSHPRLRGTVLTPAEWEQAQVLCRPADRAQWTPNAPHLLSGLMRCVNCLKTVPYVKKPARGKRPAYRCATVQCAEHSAVFADQAEAVIEDLFLRAVGDVPERRTIHEADQRLEELAELRAELRELDADLSALDVEALVVAAQRKKELLSAIQGLEERAGSAVRTEETGRTLGEVWQQADTPSRRDLIREHLAPEGFRLHPGPWSMRPGKIEITEAPDSFTAELETVLAP